MANIHGLTKDDLKQFHDLRKKANVEQLIYMRDSIEHDMEKRPDFCDGFKVITGDEQRTINELILLNEMSHLDMAKDNGWSFRKLTDNEKKALRVDIESEIMENVHKLCIKT